MAASLHSVAALAQSPAEEKTATTMDFVPAAPEAFATTNSTERTIQRIALNTGVALEYVEQGDEKGVPVILLHGITDSWHSYESTLPYLPSFLHAFALTQRGHGDSDKPQRGYSPRHFAHDVAAFIVQKKLGAAVVVGHSMGGVVAQQFAILYPQLVKALVIVDSDPVLRKNPGMPEFYEELQKMKGPQNRDYLEAFQKATLSEPIDSTYLQLLVDESMKVPHAVFVAALKGLLEVDLSSQLQQVQCPSMVFWGSNDAFCLKEGQDILRQSLPGAEWKVYEGTGHALHWEKPERFAADLAAFVRSISPMTSVKK